MNFILDENMPKKIAYFLRSQGHSASTLFEIGALGFKDGQVADLAIKNKSIILTSDRDFLEMKKERQIQLHIIYFHLEIPNYANIQQIISKNLHIWGDWLKIPGVIIVTEEKIDYCRPSI